MLWIATVFLLFVAAWLLFNGLNEKRWVDAHSHDETVASDQGLFASFSRKPMIASNDETLTIEQENTRFARAVTKFKRVSTRAGDYLDRKAQRARAPVEIARPADGKGGPMPTRLKGQGSQTVAGASSPIANSDGLFDLMVRKVSGTIDDRNAEKNRTDNKER